MSAFKKQTKSEYEKRKEFLKHKWGTNDPKANEAFEQTHQYIIKLITEQWDVLTDPQKEYFKGEIEWELMWQKRKEKDLQYQS